MNIARIMAERGIADREITFGKQYKGENLSFVREDYIRWIAGREDNASGPIGAFVADCRTIIQAIDAERDAEKRTAAVFAGRYADTRESTVFIIERLGDIDGLTMHPTLDAALAALSREYPRDEKTGHRQTPDPEDDRILIWEVLPSGHRKVVWHFSGWHHNGEEFGLEQGCLPGDDACLYTLALTDY